MKRAKIVVGLQWGDEGKGKIVDFLARSADYIVRFNGGHNAGHTVNLDGKVFKFHNLPSGALAGKKLFIAAGSVIHPKILLSEIDNLKKNGIDVQLSIDYRTHMIMPYHQMLDSASELWKGKNATGSLKLGVGFCYEDKNNRMGIRLEDLINPIILKKKIAYLYPLKKAIIEKVYGQKVLTKAEEIVREYTVYGIKLKKYCKDVSKIISDGMGKQEIIFETAHGTFLDPSFGTYPYTVAPHCIAGAVFTGIGIPPSKLEVIGVVKAYTTRVGNGPFPTEQKNKIGQLLQKEGNEVGTTSGRIRRCGWLDLTMLKEAVRLNGCNFLTLTKLDVLSIFANIKVAVTSQKRLKYISLSGWQTDIKTVRKYDKLPVNCRDYIEFIEKNLEIPVKYISVGPDRESTIIHLRLFI